MINPNVKVKIAGSAKVGRSGFFITVPVNYEGNQRIELPNLDSAGARPSSSKLLYPLGKYASFKFTSIFKSRKSIK
jgi:hypothetical protein